MEENEKYMRRCIQLARNGLCQTAPNPMVGAVIVCDGRIIGEGYHVRCGEAHAEVNAIRSVTEPSLLRRSTLYVSLEPCSHYGKTPPCADLIIEKQIPRVVIGCRDPFPKVSGRGIQNAIGAKSTSGAWIGRFINSKPIQMNLQTGVFERLNNPIPFRRNNAGGSQSITYGYEATLLIDLCNAIIDAGSDRRFEMEEEYVRNATIIVRAVAKVGIIALVDEATGYDKEKSRAKDELQKYLKQFISQEAARWVKTFDDSFFEMMYKLHNWSWSKTHKHPGIVGYWINDIVYERLGPMVLTELKKAREVSGRGKLHQYLTTDIGHPRLREHLASVQTLAKACDYNLIKFTQMLDTALPKRFQQMSLLFPDEYE